MEFIPRSVRFCTPTVIDKEDNSYTISSVFKDKTRVGDLNGQNLFQKWYNQKQNNINVTVIPFTDKLITQEELKDESFIYHSKNEILSFAHQANKMDKLKKQQEIIQKYNGSTFTIKHLEELKNIYNKVFINHLNQDASKLRLVAIFIELTWDRNIFNVEMRSPKDKKNEDSLILGLFIMNNELPSRLQHKQLVIKSTIMINRDVWMKRNCIKYPFNQLYWNTIALSQYFLNIFYAKIIVCWQRKYSKTDTITVVPFNFKSNNITYIWENKNDKISDRKYLVCHDIDSVKKGQISKPEYLYIGINSFDGIFNITDTQMLMNNIDPKEEIFFMLNNENNKISQTRLHTLTPEKVKVEEMKIEMAEKNANLMRTFIENNNENINIDISNQPKVWDLIKKKLNCYFNIKKYQFGFILSILSSTKNNSFKIPIYELKCGGTNIFFQNSEMLLFIMCMSEITVYTGDVCLIIQPGRIFTIDYNSLTHDNIIINSNGNEVSVLMLRTSPYVKSCEQMEFFDLNVELYDYEPPKRVKKKKRKYKSKKSKRKKNKIEIENYFSESESEMEYYFAESEGEMEYDCKLISQNLKQEVLQCEELTQEITSKYLKQEIFHHKMTINSGLDFTDMHEQKDYFHSLLQIHGDSPFAVEITFYLGNICEERRNYNKALYYYETSLQLARRNGTYESTFTVQHKYYCMRKLVDNIKSNMVSVVAIELRKCVFIALSNGEFSKNIRKKWINNEAVEYELMGAVTCGLCLSQYFEDIRSPLKWNDQSLIYYKASMNILEKMELIQIKNVSIDSMIDSFNPETYILKKSKPYASKKRIERKRIDQDNKFKKYVKIVETIIQNYLQTLIEKFRNKSYFPEPNDKLDLWVFYEFVTNKNRYDQDFMKYLRMEIDSCFEILHNYWSKNNNIFIKTEEMADVYNNYGAFLCDCLKDYDGAILLMEEALELNPTDVITHWNIAEIYEKTSQYKTAKICYRKVLELCDADTGKEIVDDAITSIKRVEAADKVKNISYRRKFFIDSRMQI